MFPSQSLRPGTQEPVSLSERVDSRAGWHTQSTMCHTYPCTHIKPQLYIRWQKSLINSLLIFVFFFYKISKYMCFCFLSQSPLLPKVFSFYDFSLFCCCCIFLLGCKKPCTGLISHFWTKQQLVMQCQLVFCFCGCIQWRLRVAYSVVIMCFTKQHRLAVQISKVPFFFPSFWSGPLAIAVVPHYVNNSIHRNVLLAT